MCSGPGSRPGPAPPHSCRRERGREQPHGARRTKGFERGTCSVAARLVREANPGTAGQRPAEASGERAQEESSAGRRIANQPPSQPKSPHPAAPDRCAPWDGVVPSGSPTPPLPTGACGRSCWRPRRSQSRLWPRCRASSSVPSLGSSRRRIESGPARASAGAENPSAATPGRTPEYQRSAVPTETRTVRGAPGRGDKQRRRHDQVWGPGRTQPRQLGPQRGAEFQRLAARLAIEPLEADERRIPGRAIELLRGCGCPVEEVRAFDGSTRRSLCRTRNCRGIAIDSSAAGVQGEEPTVAAGRVQHVLVRSPNGPPDQSCRRLRWCVVGAAGLLVGYLMLERLHLTTARAMAPRASREYMAAAPSAPTVPDSSQRRDGARIFQVLRSSPGLPQFLLTP